MIDKGGAPESEVVLAFLRAEVNSPCYRDRIMQHPDFEWSLIQTPDLYDERENALRGALLGYRTQLFRGFPSKTNWRRVIFEHEDFQRLKYLNHVKSWNELSDGTRLVTVGAQNIQTRAGSKLKSTILRIVEAVARGEKYPELIAAECQGGSLVLIEGHNRATAYVLAGATNGINAFVAQSPSMHEWSFC